MDKQKRLDVLGLAPSATRADARTAFRRLAKTWHPDRFAKDPVKAKIAEEKMKQVNEAFYFLLPRLPDTVAGQKGQNPSDFSHGGVTSRCSGKRSRGFFSFLAAGFRKRSNGARRRASGQENGCVGKTHTSGPNCRRGTAGKTKKTAFETVFQNVVNHTGVKPRLRQQARPSARYANYSKYFDSVPGRLKNMCHNRHRGLGPVEEISPIAPVSPVKRDR